MKPYPFTIKKRIELDIESPGALGYDIYVSIPTRGEPRLGIGCQEHTLSVWLKRGEKIITDAMVPQYAKEDLDEDFVFEEATGAERREYHSSRPADVPDGSRWECKSPWGGYVCTPLSNDERRADAKRTVNRRLAAIRAGEAQAHRAMVTLPLLIAAIQDELKAAGL